MKPTKIIGDTWYISSPLNVGWCNELMIDSGINPQQGHAMASILIQNALNVSYLINTHGHPDHCGGNSGVLASRAVRLLAVPKQIPFIENKGWVESFINGANAIAPKENSKFIDSQCSKVDEIIPYGQQYLGNCQVDIINLEGHWLDCIGILTKDNVLFCGDAILGIEEIQKYKVPLYFNIELAINSLKFLKNSNYSFYVPSHGKLTDDIGTLVDKNLSQIFEICEIVKDYCKTPATREAICTNLCKKLDVYQSPYQMQVAHSTCGSVLTFLCNTGQAIPVMQDYSVLYKSL